MRENKTNPAVLFGILGLLVVILAVAVYMLIDTRKNLNIVSADLAEKTEYFRVEKDSLEGELRNIYFRYDTLETNNLEIKAQMAIQQEKIERLISVQAEDAYKIKMYRKEMETLRSVLRSYIVQIDSLNTKNQELMAENKQLKNVERKLTTEKEQLKKDKDQLEEIKDMATTLQISDMDLVLLNKNDKTTKKVRTATKVRVDFVLRANSVAVTGDKTIYMRILRPDQVVLGSPGLELIELHGEQIPASASRVVNYEGEDLPVSVFWTNDGEIVPGEHQVELYCEGKMIGVSSFLLK
jgi:predicted RNase H-like nuclease (RuvC/YqgF family)